MKLDPKREKVFSNETVDRGWDGNNEHKSSSGECLAGLGNLVIDMWKLILERLIVIEIR